MPLFLGNVAPLFLRNSTPLFLRNHIPVLLGSLSPLLTGAWCGALVALSIVPWIASPMPGFQNRLPRPSE